MVAGPHRPARPRPPARTHRGRSMSVLSIDAGTTGVTALVVSARCRRSSRAATPSSRSTSPSEGWVEHDPNEIWAATLAAVRDALATLDAGRRPAHRGRHHQPARDRRAVGPRDARRPAARDRLAGPAYGGDLRPAARRRPRAAGRRADRAAPRPLLLGHEAVLDRAQRAARVGAGRERARRGRHGRLLPRRADDARAAPRHRRVERVAHAALRHPRGRVEPGAVRPVPRADRRAARGRAVLRRDRAAPTRRSSSASTCRSRASPATSRRRCSARPASRPGSSKCTYGTGSFVLVNTGDRPVASSTGLLTTVAWQHPDGRLTYALEGAVFVTGAAVQWLRDGLQIIASAGETEALARSVPDSGGVVFVPALTGLGAPDWDPHARGTILGISRGTTRAHIVRATLEAIAFEVQDVVDAHGPRGRRDRPRARRRRRRLGQRPPLPAAGRRAAGAGRARRDPRDHRARARRSSPGSPPGSGTPPTTSPPSYAATPGSSRARGDDDGAPPLARGRRALEVLGRPSDAAGATAPVAVARTTRRAAAADLQPRVPP